MATRKRKANDKDASLPRKRAGRGKKRNKATAIIARETTGMPITRSLRIEITDRPRQAVFATAELLENILLFVPAKQVFKLQRTAKQFRDNVTTSIQLRRKLFLHPPEGLGRRTFLAQPATHINKIFYLAGSELRGPPRVWDDYHILPFHTSFGGPVKITCDGSWKKTYLTDRPCKEAHIRVSWGFPGEIDIWGTVRLEHVTTEDSRGFDIGSLVDAAFAAIWKGRDDTDEPNTCEVAGVRRSHDGPAIDLVRALEAETGTKATLVYMEIAMLDVLVVDEAQLSAARVLGKAIESNDGQ
ncbi:hypothetical protein LTR56_024256 [Elasticomyces elasticus]|nr:hypothetical protein LTR56_024256 [Elasticomyces elasticus]KAK3639670.1 hypothetical protein LTR22_017343 [Elasticomyces elasticus]KAK4913448.1 hypothetical protein LTR49_018244 [Elasticomyces elasticus]KAK5760981.1 hypothetical protein LTS12_008829 [Elasticomyces elasticus]